MNRKFAGHVYLLIILAAVAVLAASAFFFTRYLEKQTRDNTEVSIYLSQETEASGTSQKEFSPDPTPGDSEALVGASSANDILQTLSESINNPDAVGNNYHAFRKGQLDDISPEEYRLYVKLLSEIMNGRTESYSGMTYSERKLTAEAMLEHDPELHSFLENAVFYWFEYRSGDDTLKLPILLSKNTKGQTYLSREWVKSCLELRNFSALYFGALLDQNYESAVKLMYSADPDEAILKQKTDQLMAFYREHAANDEIRNADIISLRLDAVSFAVPLNDAPLESDAVIAATASSRESEGTKSTESAPDAGTEPGDTEETGLQETQPAEETAASASAAASETPEETEVSGKAESETTRDKGTDADAPDIPETTEAAGTSPAEGETAVSQADYHYVTIYKRDGSFIAVDGVPSSEWKTEALVYKEEEPLAAVGERISPEEIYERFGLPESQSRFTFLNPAHEDEPYYRLYYPDIELIVRPGPDDASGDDASALELMSVTLRSKAYSVGGTYKIGQRLRELLESYLYIDAMDYTYQDQNNNEVELVLNENSEVRMILLQSPEYRAELLLQEMSDEVPDEIISEPGNNEEQPESSKEGRISAEITGSHRPD